LVTGDRCAQGRRTWATEVGLDVLREESGCWRLRVGRLGGGDGAAAVMIARAYVTDDKLAGFCCRRVVAVMGGFSDTAGMRGRGGRDGQRGEVARERYEQQESGDETLHAASDVLAAYQFRDADGKNRVARHG
jgi:hypothetical protein